MKPITLVPEYETRVQVGQYLALALRVVPLFLLIGGGCALAGSLAAAALVSVEFGLFSSLALGAGLVGFVLFLLWAALTSDYRLLDIRIEEEQKDNSVRRKAAGRVEIGPGSVVGFNSMITAPTVTNLGKVDSINGLPASFLSAILDVIETRGTMARSVLVGLEVDGRVVRQSDYARLVEVFNDKRWLARGRNNSYELIETPRNIRTALGLTPLPGRVLEGTIVNRTEPAK